MLSLQGEAEAHGAMLAFGTRVRAIVPHPYGLALSVNGEEAPSIVAHTVINAAGRAPEFRPRTRLKLLDTERKEFFFEKKNQKTFMSGVDVAGESRDSEATVFCFFSSEKKTFLFLSFQNRSCYSEMPCHTSHEWLEMATKYACPGEDSDDEMSLCLEWHFKIGGNGLSGLLFGWCKPESAHTWTQGHFSELAFVRPEPGRYLVSLDGITLGTQRLILSVHGVRGEYRVSGPCSVTMPFEVLEDATQASIPICFELPDANSPAAIYGENDRRILGFALCRLRVLRRTHTLRVLPPVPEGEIENAVGLSRSALVVKFESLGHNCEFGVVQRLCDAEPLGLLRFASITLDNLLRGLATEFAGLGIRDSITHTFWDENADPEYIVVENMFDLRYHSGCNRSEMNAEELYRREAKRLQFYRRKLLEDFASGEKIFVFHWHGSLMTREIMPLFAALREKGRNTLLWVVASSEHAPGTIEILREGLLRGYVGHFAPSGAVHREVDLAPWLSLCANAYMFCRKNVYQVSC